MNETDQSARGGEAFIVTKEHRRFMEFASAVRKDRYIGLCFGAASVGKTLSAKRYAHWHAVEPLLSRWGPRDASDQKGLRHPCPLTRTLLHAGCPIKLRLDARAIDQLLSRINICIDQHKQVTERTRPWDHVELVIIDEAERLNTAALEYLRDKFDRSNIGLILLGMPGIEKQMSHYPQLYSRVGFARHYRPLNGDELSFVLTRHWQQLGL